LIPEENPLADNVMTANQAKDTHTESKRIF